MDLQELLKKLSSGLTVKVETSIATDTIVKFFAGFVVSFLIIGGVAYFLTKKK